MPSGKAMKDGRKKKGPRAYSASPISKRKSIALVPKAMIDTKKRPASSGTDASEDRVKRRTLPCWFEGPLNDGKLFNEFAPKNGDMLDVIPLSDGGVTAVMTCEVVHADRLDDQGVLAILKFKGSRDERMVE